MVPFTPFHLGPGLLFGLLLFSYVDLPTFLVASVAVDIEPLLVLSLNLRYPLHGYLHTFLGRTIVAFLLAFAMNRMRDYWRTLLSGVRYNLPPAQDAYTSKETMSAISLSVHRLVNSNAGRESRGATLKHSLLTSAIASNQFGQIDLCHVASCISRLRDLRPLAPIL